MEELDIACAEVRQAAVHLDHSMLLHDFFTHCYLSLTTQVRAMGASCLDVIIATGGSMVRA